MATIKRFEDLEIWQDARRLSKEIIFISKNTDLNKDFKFNAQIKDSSGSVMDNIAEGFERNGKYRIPSISVNSKRICWRDSLTII